VRRKPGKTLRWRDSDMFGRILQTAALNIHQGGALTMKREEIFNVRVRGQNTN
jgi:hypothetical protein